MPISAPKPCRTPGCGVLVRTGGGYCPTCKPAVRKEVESRRQSSTARGYGYRWQQTSKGFLRAHPLCQCPDCKEGAVRVTAATVVDHIIAHKGDMTLFWDRNNWQSMSKQCHDKKTAREDGAFGHPIKSR